MVQKADLVSQAELSSSDSFKNSNRSRKLLIILISATLIVSGGVGGYLLGARQKQSSPTDLLTKPHPSRLPSGMPVQRFSPTSAVTSDFDLTRQWATYVDNRYGYLIKYPSNWYLVPTAEEGYGAAATITNYDSQKSSEKIGFTEYMIKVQISLIDKPAEEPFSDWAAASIQTTLQSSVNQDYGMALDHQRSVMVDGTNGIAYVFRDRTPIRSLLLYVPQGDSHIYEVTVQPADSIHLDTFETMLATFRFSK